MMDYRLIGPALALGLSAVGAAIGCGIAGMISHGIMSRIEEGHGKLLGISAAPASQLIFGFVLMLALKNAVMEGTVSAMSAAFIGGSSGFAICITAIYQGLACGSAIQATARQPSVFGKTFVAIGVLESFGIFAAIFAILLLK